MAAAPHPALDLLRELELRDAALAAAFDEVVRLEQGAEEVGARAAVVDAFLLAASDVHDRLAAALAAAEVAVGEAEQARNAADKAAALEAPLLERRAAELARGLARVAGLSRNAAGPPAAGLPGVVEWRSRARAGLLVVRGSLSRERDALLREATETAAVVAPGVVAGPTVASVRAQLEAALG